MRVVPIALAVLALSTVAAHAEDMVVTNPQGIMCRDEKALADFTAPDGGAKNIDLMSAAGNRFRTACTNSDGPVHVITKRKNTSIVTFQGATWYVPNIDYMTPTDDCIKADTHITMAGKIESGFARTDEVDPKQGYRYPRLALDKPVCYLGNRAEPAGRYVSLPATSEAGAKALMGMIGRHVTITGQLSSPDTAHQPPDNMMMFDPVVRPAG